MAADRANGTIVVFQDRRWFGDPRSGVFTVSVDGKRVGRVAVHSESAFPVAPGSHTVRIRTWWYRSLPVTVNVGSEAEARLRADILRTLSFLHRLAKGVFTPGASLVLESPDIHSDPSTKS